MTLLPNDQIVVSGLFDSAGGVSANRVARWEGGAWHPMGSGMNDQVHAVATLHNGDVVAGGFFTSAGGVSASRIARWDGSAWSPLGVGVNDEVHALLVLPNGDLVVGGRFTTAGGFPASRVARWDGTSWHAMGSGMNNPANTASIFALALLQNGDVAAGGAFVTAGGGTANRVARWNGSTWLPLGTGLNSPVDSLTVMANGDLVVGGSFTTAGGVAANRIARWNGSTWSALGSGINNIVYSLGTLPNGDLIAGGSFNNAGGNLFSNRMARWNGTSWSPLGSGLNGVCYVQRVASNGDLIVGGAFTLANGSTANRIARWRPTGGAGTSPLVSSVPGSRIAPAGSEVTLSVTASGLPAPNFHWSKNSVPIPGATTSTLVIPSMGLGDMGQYQCSISNACGTFVTSCAVTTPGSIASARLAPVNAPFTLTNVRIANRTNLINVPKAHQSLTVEDATGALTVWAPIDSIQGILAGTQAHNVLATLTGTTTNYMGHFELIDTTGFSSASRSEPISVTLVTPTDLADQSPTAEALESRLVRLEDYVFSEGGAFTPETNYTSGGASVRVNTVAIADALNHIHGGIPTGIPLAVVGVFGQFDQVAPYDAGYQIWITGISPMCPAPVHPPQTFTICAGGQASISSSGVGAGPFTYRWQRESPPAGSATWTDLSDGALPPNTGSIAVISGAATSVITIAMADAGAAARYRCRVMSPCGGVYSDAANLSINSADFNNDGDSGTDADIEVFFACLAGSCCPSCQTVDFNADGDFGTDADIEAFFRVLAGGPC